MKSVAFCRLASWPRPDKGQDTAQDQTLDDDDDQVDFESERYSQDQDDGKCRDALCLWADRTSSLPVFDQGAKSGMGQQPIMQPL